MRLIPLISLFLLFGLLPSLHTQGISECGTDALRTHLQLNDPTLRAREQAEKLAWAKAPREKSSARYTLPIVFHLVHQNGEENLSDADIQRTLRYVNQAFANTNYYDQGTGTDTQIQFCLARRDPDGFPAGGINRIESPLTEMTAPGEDIALKNLSRWAPREYINVWVVRKICGLGSEDCLVSGYAFAPTTHGRIRDGVVIEAEWLDDHPGKVGVLVHELGHYLGLRHTFEGGCKNDDCRTDGDQVCDTPPDRSRAWLPCDGTTNTCTTDTDSGFATDQNDMFVNYMDYGHFDCYSAFTPGQRERMHFFLERNRRSLTESAGCREGCPNPVTAEFTAEVTEVAAGTSVDFTNLSTPGNNYAWSVNGQLVSQDFAFSWTFTEVGSQTVRLRVSSDDPNCDPVEVRQDITVTCPVEAAFTVPPRIFVGDTVVFSNQSLGADAGAWELDGSAVNGAADLQWSFDEEGLYDLCLRASNAFCEEVRCRKVYVTTQPVSGTDTDDSFQDCGSAFNLVYKRPVNGAPGSVTCITPHSDGYYLGLNFEDASATVMSSPGLAVPHVPWSLNLDLPRFRTMIKKMIIDRNGMLVGIGGTRVNDINRAFIFQVDPSTGSLRWGKLLGSSSTDISLAAVFHPEDQEGYVLFGGINSQDQSGALQFLVNPENGDIRESSIIHYSPGNEEEFSGQITDAVYDSTANRFHLLMAKRQEMYLLTLLDDYAVHQVSQLLPDVEDVGRPISGPLSLDIRESEIFILYGMLKWHVWKLSRDHQLLSVNEFTPGTNSFAERIIANQEGYLVSGYHLPSSQQALVQLTKYGEMVWGRTYSGPSYIRQRRSGHLAVHQGGILLGGLRRNRFPMLNRLRANGTSISICNPTGNLRVSGRSIIGKLETSQIRSRAGTITSENFGGQGGNIIPDTDNCLEPCPDPAVIPSSPCNAPATYQYQGDSTVFTAVASAIHGRYVGGSQGKQAYVAALETDGSIRWQYKLAGVQHPVRISEIIIDSEGMLIGIAETYQTALQQYNYVFRIHPLTGVPLWIKQYYQLRSSSFKNVMDTDPNGHLLITGFHFWNGDPSKQGLVLRLDRNTGEPIEQNYPNSPVERSGYQDAAYDESTENVYTIATDYGDSEQLALIVTAISPDNEIRWAKRLEREINLYSQSIRVDESAIYVSGYSGFAENNSLNFIVALNKDGTLRSSKSVPTSLQDLKDIVLVGGKTISLFTENSFFGLNGRSIFVESPENFTARHFNTEHQVTGRNGFLSDGEQLLLVGKTLASEPILEVMELDGNEAPGCASNLVISNGQSSNSFSIALSDQRIVPVTEQHDWTVMDAQFTPANLQLDQNNSCLPDCAALEICDNLADDDFDGFVDCEDPDLQNTCCCKTAVPPVLGPDTILCAGGNFVLRVRADYDQYRWSNGSRADSLLVEQAGTYWLTTVDSCGNVAMDTLTLHLRPRPLLELGSDTTLCSNAVVPLVVQDGFASYEWTDGSTEKQFTADAAGTYWVMATDSCGGLQSDTVRVIIDPVSKIDLGPDTSICSGETLTFRLDGFSRYQWSRSSYLSCGDCAEVRFAPTQDTLLIVAADLGPGCVSSDSIRVRVTASDRLELPGDIRLPLGDSLRLQARLNTSGGHPDWYLPGVDSCFNCPVFTVRPHESAYIYANTFGGCPATDSLYLTIVKDRIAYLPNAFSPNGDGVNDVFRIFAGPAVVKVLSLTVYNRYGAEVFHATEQEEPAWDGRAPNGRLAAGGVYVYRLQIRLLDGSTVVLAGDITLLR